MIEKKLVSVIAPCYNGEKYLDNFLESVLAQDYPRIELIFVNDGSSDRTEEIAFSYQSRFSEKGYTFCYIYQSNAGQAAAINKGLKLFTGDYMMWMDSDDIMLSSHVSEKVSFLEAHPEYGFLLAQGENVNSDDINRRISILQRKKPSGKDDLFADLIFERNVVFCPGTIMARSEAFKAAIPSGEIYESREGQNWQLMLPLAYMYRCGYLEKVLFKCVAHPDSHSRTKRNYNAWMTRYDGFQTLLTNTISVIPQMDESEKQAWCEVVELKYAKRKLECAYKYGKFGEIRSRKESLRNLGYQFRFEDTFIVYWLKTAVRIIKRHLRF